MIISNQNIPHWFLSKTTLFICLIVVEWKEIKQRVSQYQEGSKENEGGKTEQVQESKNYSIKPKRHQKNGK